MINSKKICESCDVGQEMGFESGYWICDECNSSVEAEEMVTISKDRYDDLKETEDFMFALQAAGVDNWEGYGIAIDIRDGE